MIIDILYLLVVYNMYPICPENASLVQPDPGLKSPYSTSTFPSWMVNALGFLWTCSDSTQTPRSPPQPQDRKPEQDTASCCPSAASLMGPLASFQIRIKTSTQGKHSAVGVWQESSPGTNLQMPFTFGKWSQGAESGWNLTVVLLFSSLMWLFCSCFSNSPLKQGESVLKSGRLIFVNNPLNPYFI